MAWEVVIFDSEDESRISVGEFTEYDDARKCADRLILEYKDEEEDVQVLIREIHQ